MHDNQNDDDDDEDGGDGDDGEYSDVWYGCNHYHNHCAAANEGHLNLHQVCRKKLLPFIIAIITTIIIKGNTF